MQFGQRIKQCNLRQGERIEEQEAKREENRRDDRETGRGVGDAQKTNGYPLKAAKSWWQDVR